MRLERLGLIQRIGIEVHAPTERVAQRARAEDRQDHIRPATGAPAAEGLAEVLVVLLIAHVGSDVVEAKQAYSGIKRNTRPIADTVLELSLQEIVHADEDVADVAEEVAQPVAVLQHHAVAARFEPDVLLAEDAGGEDLRGGVARKLVLVAEIDGNDGLVGLVVEADVGDAPDHDAGALHRRAHLEAADVAELGLYLVHLRGRERSEVADLQGEEQEPRDAGDDEGPDPEVNGRAVHW